MGKGPSDLYPHLFFCKYELKMKLSFPIIHYNRHQDLDVIIFL